MGDGRQKREAQKTQGLAHRARRSVTSPYEVRERSRRSTTPRSRFARRDGVGEGPRKKNSAAAKRHPPAELLKASILDPAKTFLFLGPSPGAFQRALLLATGDRRLIKAAGRLRKPMRSLKNAALSRSSGEDQKRVTDGCTKEAASRRVTPPSAQLLTILTS
jgi:hypothetical protein